MPQPPDKTCTRQDLQVAKTACATDSPRLTAAWCCKIKFSKQMEILTTIALLSDLPERQLVRRSHLGTIVERLAPAVFEVEFGNDELRSCEPGGARWKADTSVPSVG